jgi:hypothetical protein
MTQELLASETVLELWKDSIWDRLLDSLDERSVIPIVGPDLLQVEIDGTTTLLDQYIARRLAQMYRLPVDNLPADRALNYVVYELTPRRDHYAICEDIFQIMKEASFRPSKSLRQLAEITDFNLFVSTTFDSLLEKAINEVRFGNAPGTMSIAYSKRVDDLPSSKDRLAKPTVYYLMGKLSASGAYVISDEDLLEQVCDLQSPARRPERLFDELKKNHLLMLGVDYSDWLVRIFLRTAKGGRLSASATQGIFEILADSKTRQDPGLVSFLVHFSSHTRVFRTGGAVEFVDELWNRWRERHPQSKPLEEEMRHRDMPRNAIFISYMREDLAAVLELKAGLEAAGLPVWFDRQSLKPGDNFNPQIEQYISRSCSCFVAVISRNTERRDEGFFRREWNMALERDRGIHFARKFIVPVVVDDTAEPSIVPPRFSQLNYTWLPGGKVTPPFVRELKEILSGS